MATTGGTARRRALDATVFDFPKMAAVAALPVFGSYAEGATLNM
jgi:hypothetical protein